MHKKINDFKPDYLNRINSSCELLAFLLFLAMLITSCGVYGKNIYESGYNSNMESYSIDEVAVYLSINIPFYERSLYDLFYDDAIVALNLNGYKTIRLSESEIA